METISIIGMIAALCLLSFLVMKGVNIFIAAIASAFVVALTGGIGLYDALHTSYMGGFTGFFGSNFLIFVAGALMGQVYEKTNGAKAIARLIISKLGKGAAMIAVPLAIGILTYGGIAGVVIGAFIDNTGYNGVWIFSSIMYAVVFLMSFVIFRKYMFSKKSTADS